MATSLAKAKIIAASRVRVAQQTPFVPQALHDGPTAAVVYEPSGIYYVRDRTTGRDNERQYIEPQAAIDDLAQRWYDQKVKENEQ